MFGMEKGKMVGLPHHPHGEKEKMFTRFNTIHEHGDDGGTPDPRSDGHRKSDFLGCAMDVCIIQTSMAALCSITAVARQKIMITDERVYD